MLIIPRYPKCKSLVKYITVLPSFFPLRIFPTKSHKFHLSAWYHLVRNLRFRPKNTYYSVLKSTSVGVFNAQTKSAMDFSKQYKL